MISISITDWYQGIGYENRISENQERESVNDEANYPTKNGDNILLVSVNFLLSKK